MTWQERRNKNKDKYLEYQRKWREAHRQEIRDKANARYVPHPRQYGNEYSEVGKAVYTLACAIQKLLRQEPRADTVLGVEILL